MVENKKQNKNGEIMSKLKKLGLMVLFIWPQIIFANPINVTLHYIGPTDGQVWAGVQQGLTEANLQGQFLGQNYQVKNVTEQELAALPESEITAVLVGTDAKHILDVAKMKKLAHVPVFNLSSDADGLRQACLSNLLNIPLSKQMKADALAQWQAKNPDTLVTAHAWHHDFVKFAASQLNKRFTRNHKTQMDDDEIIEISDDDSSKEDNKIKKKVYGYAEIRDASTKEGKYGIGGLRVTAIWYENE